MLCGRPFAGVRNIRWLVWAFSFIVAFVVGVAVSLNPLISEGLRPSFTKEEVAHKLGDRVRHHRSVDFRLMKCLRDEPCLEVKDGEYGTIIGIEPVADGGYFLKVRWDHPVDHYVSYLGRYTARKSLGD